VLHCGRCARQRCPGHRHQRRRQRRHPRPCVPRHLRSRAFGRQCKLLCALAHNPSAPACNRLLHGRRQRRLELLERVLLRQRARLYPPEIVDLCRQAIVDPCRALLLVLVQVVRDPGSRCARNNRAEVQAAQAAPILRARLVPVERRGLPLVPLSNVAAHCLRERDPDRGHPAARGCFRRCRMRKLHRKPNLASRCIRASRLRGSARASINASRKASASYIQRGSALDLATGVRLRRS